jgi:hypothetical protein
MGISSRTPRLTQLLNRPSGDDGGGDGKRKTRHNGGELEVPLTGTLGGEKPFAGTVRIKHFVAAPDGIKVEIAGVIGDDGVIVANKQQLALQNVVVLTDPKLGQEVLEFELSAVKDTRGGTFVPKPLRLTESQLPAGARGKLQKLGHATGIGVLTSDAPSGRDHLPGIPPINSGVAAALLNAAFALPPVPAATK